MPETILTVRHASWVFNPITGVAVFYISALAKTESGVCVCYVWKSTNLGATWEKAITGLETYSPSDPPVFSQVSTCERDARRVYLIAEKFPELDDSGKRLESYGILKSTDEGASWEWVVKMDDDHDPPNRTGGWAERDYGAKWGDIKGDDQISPKGRFAWDVVASPVDPHAASGWTQGIPIAGPGPRKASAPARSPVPSA